MSMNKKMSRIERLIAEKCPEGVEYRALSERPPYPKHHFPQHPYSKASKTIMLQICRTTEQNPVIKSKNTGTISR